MTAMRYIENAVTLQMDASRCRGCGLCQAVCPHAVFEMRDGCAVIADRGACMECGACVRNCEFGALSVRPGVGCAAGVIMSYFKRRATVEFGCGDDTDAGCCN